MSKKRKKSTLNRITKAQKKMPPKMSRMAESKGGAGSPNPTGAGAPPTMAELKRGDWGRLPPKMAEDISKGLSETIPTEYREAVETYYRVIAEKSKKP